VNPQPSRAKAQIVKNLQNQCSIVLLGHGNDKFARIFVGE